MAQSRSSGRFNSRLTG